MDLTFEQYVAAIQALAEADGASLPGNPYCDPEAWRDAYSDGLTPQEAWEAEQDAASLMVG